MTAIEHADALDWLAAREPGSAAAVINHDRLRVRAGSGDCPAGACLSMTPRSAEVPRFGPGHDRLRTDAR